MGVGGFIGVVWEMKKDGVKYRLKGFMWEVGGKFRWGVDKEKLE